MDKRHAVKRMPVPCGDACLCVCLDDVHPLFCLPPPPFTHIHIFLLLFAKEGQGELKTSVLGSFRCNVLVTVSDTFSVSFRKLEFPRICNSATGMWSFGDRSFNYAPNCSEARQQVQSTFVLQAYTRSGVQKLETTGNQRLHRRRCLGNN